MLILSTNKGGTTAYTEDRVQDGCPEGNATIVLSCPTDVFITKEEFTARVYAYVTYLRAYVPSMQGFGIEAHDETGDSSWCEGAELYLTYDTGLLGPQGEEHLDALASHVEKRVEEHTTTLCDLAAGTLTLAEAVEAIDPVLQLRSFAQALGLE